MLLLIWIASKHSFRTDRYIWFCTDTVQTMIRNSYWHTFSSILYQTFSPTGPFQKLDNCKLTCRAENLLYSVYLSDFSCYRMILPMFNKSSAVDIKNGPSLCFILTKKIVKQKIVKLKIVKLGKRAADIKIVRRFWLFSWKKKSLSKNR